MADYLFKFGNYIFPMEYIAEGGYDSAPNQRQDLDPFTDQFGLTHRNTLLHTKTNVTIKTRELKWDEVQSIMQGLTSNYTSEKERDATCEYFDNENFTWKEGHMYLDPSLKFTVKQFNDKIKPITFQFIEY